MRDKNLSLKLFKNIAILNQFLYEEGHSIEYNNGITTLKITMDENFEYRVFNPNFPETKPTIFSSEMTIPVIANKIEDLKEIDQKTKKLNNYSFKLGIISDNSNRKKNDISNADLLIIHEFGSPARNIPSRPILRTTIERSTEILNETIEKSIQLIIEGESFEKIEKTLKQSALKIENLARNIVYDRNHSFIPNSPKTIRSKKSDLPLFDTGQLVKSIKCFVFNEKNQLI